MKHSSRFRLSGKKILIGMGIIFGIILITVFFNINRLSRLYFVITLFEPERIGENFRTMGERMDSREVKTGAKTFVFQRQPRALPESYEFNGQKKGVREFMEHTGTTGMIVVKDNTILFEEYYQGNTDKSKAI
jgi:hypothetical protein